ncbi:MAG: glycosyltransferase family 4 protein [candidate division Zixibacteria bacterium]|nr:glycosyltransferase family 4 protein [candidate division Zixibacteria bacterium]
MNILIAVPWHTPGSVGGVGIAVRKISEVLGQKDHKITYLVHGENQSVEFVEDDHGRPIYSMYLRFVRSKKWSVKALIAFLFYLPPTLLRLRRFLRQNHIDVTVIFYPGAHHLYFRLLKALSSIRYAVAVQGSDIRTEAHEHWLVKRAVTALIRNADALVANSNNMLEAARNLAGVVPKRSEVIYVGIDPKWSQSTVTTSHALPPKYILTLACPTPVKGPDIIIEAFRQMCDRYPDVSLVMVGSGPQEREVRQLIDDLGLSGRILRLGDVPHEALPAIYHQALFGVIPSRSEAFGLVSLEFQLMGKAIVATNVGGLPESITDGFNGFLVAPECPSEMARKMSELLDKPELCRTMGENGRGRVLRDFSLKTTGEKFDRLLSDVVSDRWGKLARQSDQLSGSSV